MGPEGFQSNDVYLRTAVSVDSSGWASYGKVKMPDYRWGIFLNERNPEKKIRIENLSLLLMSVLDARKRVMIEVNAPADKLDSVVSLLPCMREATVSPLFGDSGYAIKAAVPKEILPELIPSVKAAGGSDVVITSLSQIVP